MQAEIVRILDTFTELQTKLEEELTARQKQYEYYRDSLLNFNHKIGEVQWVKLGDAILSLKTGLNPRQNFKLNESGSYLPYITGKDIYNNSINITDKTDKITDKALTLINKRADLEQDLLLFASTGTGTVGRMAIIKSYNNDFGISETLYAMKVNKRIILNSFLMHYLYSSYAQNQFVPKISKGSVPHLKINDLQNVIIPVPPLDVQQRIVEVLDNFEKICTDLKIGLPAEINARKQQYEYYRDKLLTFRKKDEL